MTTIGILSDTHSCWDPKFEKYFADCDEIWHAGDVGCIDIIDRLQELVPVVRIVHGNIDHGEVKRQTPALLEFEVDGAKVLLTHIGGYPGKYAPGMKKLLKDRKTTIMVCGHSHILRVIPDSELGLLHINPGAAGHHGWQKERTLIRLKIDNGIPTSLEVIELA